MSLFVAGQRRATVLAGQRNSDTQRYRAAGTPWEPPKGQRVYYSALFDSNVNRRLIVATTRAHGILVYGALAARSRLAAHRSSKFKYFEFSDGSRRVGE